MITLNTKEKINKSKMRVGRGIGSVKVKLLEEVLEVKNRDQVLRLEVVKVVK